MPRFCFVLKHRDASWGVYTDYGGYTLPSGLRNSVKYIVQMLRGLGFDAEQFEVIDGNGIDRVITAYDPDYAIIEAFWCPPAKFTELQSLWRHRKRRWMVRDHSETPFAAMESMAFTYIAGYLATNVEVTCNSPRALSDLRGLGWAATPDLLSFSPNWYPISGTNYNDSTPHPDRGDGVIRVSCFGSVRPLKDTLIQMTAAIAFAQIIGKHLEFYVNTSRVEMGANPVLKNIRAVAEATPNCSLIEVPWLDIDDFLSLLQTIDIAMQVSLSETFNLASCDAVSQNCPIVVSPEIPWVGSYAHADPNDGTSIVQQLLNVYHDPTPRRRIQRQRSDLLNYSKYSENVWYSRFA